MVVTAEEGFSGGQGGPCPGRGGAGSETASNESRFEGDPEMSPILFGCLCPLEVCLGVELGAKRPALW